AIRISARRIRFAIVQAPVAVPVLFVVVETVVVRIEIQVVGTSVTIGVSGISVWSPFIRIEETVPVRIVIGQGSRAARRTRPVYGRGASRGGGPSWCTVSTRGRFGIVSGRPRTAISSLFGRATHSAFVVVAWG